MMLTGKLLQNAVKKRFYPLFRQNLIWVIFISACLPHHLKITGSNLFDTDFTQKSRTE